MSSKVWSIGIQKHTKMIQHHVHIRSTYQFNQVEVHEKNDRNYINSGDANRVWLCIRVTFSSIGKLLDYLLTDMWLLKFFSSFSLVVGCGSTFVRDLPNMSQLSLMATGQPLHVFVCWGKNVTFKKLRSYHDGACL